MVIAITRSESGIPLLVKTENASALACLMGMLRWSGYHHHMISDLPKLVRRFDPRTNASLPDLGERELLVLEVLWEHGEVTARSVCHEMPGAGVSLSTVQSTLERLHRKQLAVRSKQGRAYVYRAALRREELISGLLHDLADNFAAGELAPMISGFLDYLSGQAPDLGADVSRALRRQDSDESAQSDD